MPIINPTDIATHCPEMPTVLDTDKKALTYINDAELQDIRPILGEVFYKHILDNLTGDTEITKLLNGGSYEYAEDTYPLPGLKEVVARFTFARYIFFGASTQSGFGTIIKQNQDAREATYQEKKDRYHTNRQIASDQWSLIHDFLCRNSSDYPLYRKGTMTPKRRITTIRK